MKYQLLLAISGLLLIGSCSSPEKKSPSGEEVPKLSIKTEQVSYVSDSVTMNGFVAYNAASNDKRPVVLIVHEWWGLNDYVRSRAKQLASLGYLAMAVDMYGDGKIAEDPEMAGKMAGPFYKDPQKMKRRFNAALVKAKSYTIADTTKTAAIGYCFGGAVVLNVARLGADLNGVVSFHGSLIGVTPDKNKLKANVLVCHGEDDKFVKPEEVNQFKKQMDSINAPYIFRSYPNATHAFTNPQATETGKKFSMPIEYNPSADTASFQDMKAFLGEIFK